MLEAKALTPRHIATAKWDSEKQRDGQHPIPASKPKRRHALPQFRSKESRACDATTKGPRGWERICWKRISVCDVPAPPREGAGRNASESELKKTEGEEEGEEKKKEGEEEVR